MMKKIISLLLVGAMGLQMVGCSANQQINNNNGTTLVQASDLMADVEPGVVEPVKPDEDFKNSQMKFAIDLFQEAVKSEEGANVLISPTSAQMALAMTANGADGNTKTEMENVLASGMTIEELNAYWYSYLLQMRADDSVKMANSIWFRDEEGRLAVEKDFLQTNADYYGANIYKSAFDDKTLQDINTWVEEHTDGMIKSILNQIPADAVMYLINALAFEAEWKEEYEKGHIFDGTFTNAKGEMQEVEMMRSEETICFEGDDFVGFKKNYKGDKYGFVALLPNENTDISEFISEMEYEQLLELLENPSQKYAEVIMPKFSYSYTTLLNDALTNMGMPSAFSASDADFSKLGRSTNGNISIGRVIQKTFITVDEVGTKAGAATVVEMTDECCPMYDLTIRLDRPFVYMIIDNETNLPLFIGTLMNIEN